MTPTPELKRLAEEAISLACGDWFTANDFRSYEPEDAAYIAAANPARVLQLIEENERLRAVCDRVSKLTVAGRDPVTDPVVQKYPLLGELVSAARQALGGQSHE